MPRYGWELVICVAVVLAVLFAFSPLLSKDYEFLRNDDGDYVAENPHVNSGLTADNVAWAFTAFHSWNWHPLTWLSLQLDSELYGVAPNLAPSGYRLTNILLHAAAAVLLFAALRLMTGALWPSAMVAGLFALHPLHVESVAWISERKDVLSGVFWMLTLLSYAYYTARPSLGRYCVVVISFALGLMAKPMLVTLPFVLLLLDFWPLRRLRNAELPVLNPPQGTLRTQHTTIGALILEKLPLVVLSAASSLITMRAQSGLVEEAVEYFPWDSRALNAAQAYLAYIGKMFWPANLGIFYPHGQDIGSSLTGLLAGALLLVITVVVIWAAKRLPYLAVGWFWYLGTLVPVIGLVQVGMQGLADRYTYIPLIGLFIMIVWEASRTIALGRPWQAGLAIVGAVVLVACACITWRQVQFWQNSLTLWHQTFLVTADNKFTRNQLGQSLMYRGQLDEAQEHFEAALRLDPKYNRARVNLAACLNRQGKSSEAIAQLEDALVLGYGSEESALRFRLGLALLRMPGRRPEGLQHLEKAVALKPHFADAHFTLGLAYLEHGDAAKAMDHLQAVTAETSPLAAPAYSNLAMAYFLQGQPQKALHSAQTAFQLDSNQAEAAYYLAYALDLQGSAEAARAQYERAVSSQHGWLDAVARSAWIEATHPDSPPRNGKLAVIQADIACRATGQRDARWLDILAAALAEVGRFDEAMSTARQAHALAAGSNPALANEIQHRIERYENRQPWRAP